MMKQKLSKKLGVAVLLIFAVAVFMSCEKETTNNIDLTIYATYSDYQSYKASYISVTSISVDGVAASYDFDGWSNIGVGDTRKIQVSVKTENEVVSVRVSSSGSGSGITMVAAISDVVSGDELYLDLDTGTFITN